MSRAVFTSTLLISMVLTIGAGNAAADSWRDNALARGAQLPKPFGIGFSYLTQDQDYSIDSLTLGIDSIDPAVATNVGIRNDTTAVHLTTDYWVLPFLDVYGILGQVDANTKVNLSQINIGLPLQDLDLDYDGLLYGGGIVLAWGGEHAFGALDLSYSWTSLDISTSSVEMFVGTPRFGWDFGKTTVWGGGMYQSPEERHQGVVDIPGLGPVPFDVKLRARDKWNYIVGLNTEIGAHWVLSLEGGFGPRTMGIAHVDYRF